MQIGNGNINYSYIPVVYRANTVYSDTGINKYHSLVIQQQSSSYVRKLTRFYSIYYFENCWYLGSGSYLQNLRHRFEWISYNMLNGGSMRPGKWKRVISIISIQYNCCLICLKLTVYIKMIKNDFRLHSFKFIMRKKQTIKNCNSINLTTCFRPCVGSHSGLQSIVNTRTETFS